MFSEGKHNRRADVSNRVPSRKTLRNRLQIAALSDDNLRTGEALTTTEISRYSNNIVPQDTALVMHGSVGILDPRCVM